MEVGDWVVGVITIVEMAWGLFWGGGCFLVGRVTTVLGRDLLLEYKKGGDVSDDDKLWGCDPFCIYQVSI